MLLALLCAVLLLQGLALYLDVHHTALTRDRIKAAGRRDEAWRNLFGTLQFRAPLPVITDYTASPELMVLVVNLIAERKPRRVLELGSGLSTVVAGYALERFVGADARLLSVDHEAVFAEQSAALVRRHGLEGVTVRHAPLQSVNTPHGAIRWYSRAALDLDGLAPDSPDRDAVGPDAVRADAVGPDAVGPDAVGPDAVRADAVGPDALDLLIVDGPPGKDQRMARYPALQELLPRLRPGSIVVLDDARRPDERRAAEEWSAQLGTELEFWDVGKGVALLRVPEKAAVAAE